MENRATEIERLQTENDALRERVRLLEEGEMHDITQKVGMKVNTDGPSSKEITGMGNLRCFWFLFWYPNSEGADLSA